MSDRQARWRDINGIAVEASFLKTFEELGGLQVFGCPVSPGVFAGDTLQQYFNHGRLEAPGRSTPYPVGVPRVADLGRAMSRAVSAAPLVRFTNSLSTPWADESRRLRAGRPVGNPVQWRGWRIQFYEREAVRMLDRYPGVSQPHPGHLGDLFISLNEQERFAGEGRVAPIARPIVANSRDVHAPILTYHHSRGASALYAQLTGLLSAGLTPISFEQLVAAVEGWADVPQGAFLISFDDGWSAQIQDALPVLRDLRAPATFFVMPGFDRHGQGHMSLADFRGLRDAGITVASHTLNHANLPSLYKANIGAAQAEVVQSRDELEAEVDGVDFFAYPEGRFDDDVEKLIRDAGYRAAVTTMPGIVHSKSRLFTLRRVGVEASWPVADVIRAIRRAALTEEVPSPI